MKPQPGKPVHTSNREQKHPFALTYVVIPFLFLFLSSQSIFHAAAQSSNAASPDRGETELNRRLQAASQARKSDDPAILVLATERLIAYGLREMAYLRVIESAYQQGIDLYDRSLYFEDSADTRTDLAMAEVLAGRFDDAIRQANQVLSAEPGNLRAQRALGDALAQKGEYAQAVAPLTRVANAEPTIENLYALAVCLLQTKNSADKQRAATVFSEMEKIAGTTGSLHVLFGRAYRDADDMPAAVKEFKVAVALDPAAPHAHYFLGLAELALNEWKPTPESEAEMKAEVKNFPNDYLANYMLGFSMSSERRYKEAEPYLENAARINPTAPEPFLFMGLNAYAEDDSQRAEQMLRKAVLLTGNDEARLNYQIRRAYVDLGRILSASGRKDEAEVFLAKARDLQNKTMQQSQQSIASIALAGGAGSAAAVVPLSKNEENAAAPLTAGNGDPTARLDAASLASSKLAPEQRTAAEAREKVLRTTLALAFNDLATSEALRQEYRRALSYYQQAEQWDSSLAGLQKNLGQCAFRAREYPEAIRALSEALKQQDSLALRAMLGVSYFTTNQYQAAARTFTPLGHSGMLDAETGYAWADSLARTGDMKKAAEVLTVFQSQPRPPEVMLLIGELWTGMGDYERAVGTFDQILSQNPNAAKAHLYSGLAYIHWQRWPEAAKEFRAELAISPGDPDALYHLGFVDLQEARTDEATALFRQVIASHPDYANAQYQLGKIMLDRGQLPEAVDYLESAARLSPQTDYIHYQLQAAYRKEDRVADADHELQIYKQLKATSREHAAEAIKANP